MITGCYCMRVWINWLVGSYKSVFSGVIGWGVETSVQRRWKELYAFGMEVDGNGEEVGYVGRKANHEGSNENTEGRKTESKLITRQERMWYKVLVWLYFSVVLFQLLLAALECLGANLNIVYGTYFRQIVWKEDDGRSTLMNTASRRGYIVPVLSSAAYFT